MAILVTVLTWVVVGDGVAGEVWVGVEVVSHLGPVKVVSGARRVVEDGIEGAGGIVTLTPVAPHTPHPRPTLICNGTDQTI